MRTVSIASGGTLAPGTAAIGTLTINNNLALAGNALFKVNKSTAPSNDIVVVSGGTLTVTNLGYALNIGDRFYLFNSALSGGGVNWINRLATDGSIQVLSISSGVTVITSSPAIQSITLAGSNVVLTGTNGQTGVTAYLLMTTNLANSITTWKTVSTNVLGGNAYTFTGTNVITPALGRQFYRLSSTNYNS